MDRKHSLRGVVAGLTVLVAGLFAGAGLLDNSARQDAQKAKVKENFDSLKEAMSEFNGRFSDTVRSSVQVERLISAKSKKTGGWSCEEALASAKETNKDRKSELKTRADRVKRHWDAARSAARGLDPLAQPWGTELQQVTAKVVAVASLFRDVDSSKTSQGEKSIAALWSSVQEYAAGMPSCLPSADAEKMVPATVHVPCINQTVRMR